MRDQTKLHADGTALMYHIITYHMGSISNQVSLDSYGPCYGPHSSSEFCSVITIIINQILEKCS